MFLYKKKCIIKVTKPPNNELKYYFFVTTKNNQIHLHNFTKEQNKKLNK